MNLLFELKTFYAKNKRTLPWRPSQVRGHKGQVDPYAILVSEVMLQQTQVDRVIPKYQAFMKAFPTAGVLARAPFPKVLTFWSGLGYNRRAKFLQQAAQAVVQKHGGVFPTTVEELQKLPGVGPYTAGAIAAFAYNAPVVFIETNIRTVFLYFSFLQKTKIAAKGKIADAELLPLVGQVLRKSQMQPRDFYAALMDYGSYLKAQGVRLNSKSKHYSKQKKFVGSNRQLRGAILKLLLEHPQTKKQLDSHFLAHAKKYQPATVIDSLPKRVAAELAKLVKEEMLVRAEGKFRIKK